MPVPRQGAGRPGRESTGGKAPDAFRTISEVSEELDLPILSGKGQSVRIYLLWSLWHPQILCLWGFGCPSAAVNGLFFELDGANESIVLL